MFPFFYAFFLANDLFLKKASSFINCFFEWLICLLKKPSVMLLKAFLIFLFLLTRYLNKFIVACF
jgi:hypothetical protein